MPLLPSKQIREIHHVAVEAGLDRKRATMLAGLAPGYVAGFQGENASDAQLLLDLFRMNNDGTIAGEVTPLEEWLLTAKALSGQFPDRQKFFSDMVEQVARTATAAAPASPARDARVPERILFRDTLLPAHFLAGALRTAQSVARVVVPQIEGGVQRVNASSGKPTTGFGTGWLIGPQHLITNWHVVEARAAGEEHPALEDVRLQCASAIAEFDYDEQDAPPGFARSVAALEHHNAKLDYVILHLAPAEGAPQRPQLPLHASFALSAVEPFPVNIIQHPRGAAKQLGIRNNLASALTQDELTYFTDTAGGSSGSPVCDDAWRVIALHRGTRPVLQKLNFQGKETAWINSGTPIRPIIEDLKLNAAVLWAAIGAIIE